MFTPATSGRGFSLYDIFNMKKLIICGKANMEKSVAEIREKKCELWMLGTDPREGADRYFELHGINVTHPNTTYELPDEVYETGLPVNNSISAVLIYAWLSGYKEVSIVGAPMNSKLEYIEERPALAYVVGALAASGMKLEWDGMPENHNYGRNKKPVKAENEMVEAENEMVEAENGTKTE